jgi:ribulose-5-phosphate 4-epimerase/fuculose-1-phosphate aldolase
VPNATTAQETMSMAVGSDTAAYAFETPPTFDSVEDERCYRKRELALALRLFGKLGFGEGVAGHITVRDPQHPQHLWVNPFGVSFHRIKASDLIRIDNHANIIEGNRPVNKAALCIHSEVHNARPDALAVAHAHSLHGKAFSSLHRLLDPITQDACQFYNDHGLYDDFGGVATDREEGARIAKALGSYKAVLLANHGILTVGQTVPEAAWWFITMERSCQAQLLALAAGEPQKIDHETATTVRRQTGFPLAGWFQLRPMQAEILAEQPDLLD